MRLIARLGLVLLVIVCLVALAVAVYAWRAMPRLDGELAAPGLSAPVTLERDEADVTHIRAQSPHDAWFALGYVHAQERGWQLEFNRRTLRGELSEVLGAATASTDALLRTLGIRRAAERQLANLPADALEALQAYSDGINAFHEHGGQALPPEFHILGTRPGRWEPADSVGWALMMALDLGGNWGTEFARLQAAAVLDTERLWQLFAPYPGEPPAASADLAMLYASLQVYRGSRPPGTPWQESPTFSTDAGGGLPAAAAWARRFAEGLGEPHGKGSNNWAVAGSHTASGRPLLANDPHLGLSAPAIWYFARLEAPGLDVIGATLPGLPFVVLGRTAGVAWSFTNTGPDVQDLYLEQINPADPTQYRTPERWEPFRTRRETIVIKDHPDLAITVRETRHGPVLSDVQRSHAALLDTDRYVLSLRWAALEPDNRTVLAGLRFNQAQTVEELIEAGRDYHSPMQSVVMADTTGRVAMRAMGRAPLRRDDNDIRGMAPSPGWREQYEWAGWLAYEDNPHEEIEDGWIATANQRIMPADYPFFLGQDWAEPYRFARIDELLAATPRHDMASMQAIQADVRSGSALDLLPYLRDARSPHPLAAAAQRELAGFDGAMRADAAAPLIVAAWADELARGVIAPRLGEARFAALYGRRQFRDALLGILRRDDDWWCAPQSCADQVSAAFTRALNRLAETYGAQVAAWRWGEAHPALSTHRPFGHVPTLARLFDVSVPSGGDGYTVNVGQYWVDEEQPFANRHAASLRAIYDLADLENSVFIYQTGQSGVVFSSSYRNMRDEWASGAYRPLRMRPERIRHTATLLP